MEVIISGEPDKINAFMLALQKWQCIKSGTSLDPETRLSSDADILRLDIPVSNIEFLDLAERCMFESMSPDKKAKSLEIVKHCLESQTFKIEGGSLGVW